MNEWLNKDIFARILACFIAVVLWFVVVYDEQSAQKERMQADRIERILSVGISVRNLEPGLAAVGLPSEVSLRVRGSMKAVQEVEKLARAEVNLSDRAEGENLVRVSPILPNSIELLSIDPASIIVRLEKIVKKSIPIKGSVIGNPLAGYTIGRVVIEPNEAAVKGPSGKISQIEELLAAIDVTDRDSSFSVDLEVFAADGTGKRIDDVDIKPGTVRATIPVRKVWSTEKVQVVPVVTGEPAPGYRVKSISVEPKAVDIMLSENDTEGRILTQELNIEGASEPVKKVVKLSPPEGVSLFKDDTVVISVNITQFSGNEEEADHPDTADSQEPDAEEAQ